ncbi:hypothetical protein [Streptomyces sp. NPDC059943]|uniref:hypothetical protein n=1 Tax=Streptomyces sp. NPDC059943 TaxID=3347010 RepID=UPI00365F62EA
MHPADLARYLGLYAERVMTPRGTTATTGLELMVALRPPTRAQKDETTGAFERAYNDDALTAVTPWWSARSPTNTRSSRASSPGTTCAPRRRC